jgi:preprotein translocase subunit SecE
MVDRSAGWVGNAQQYITEVRGEFNKITWPPQAEMVNGTVAVVIIVSLIAAFLGIVDFALSRVVKQVLG